MSTGTADLTSVGARIDSGNYPAAIKGLRGLAEDYQGADVCKRLGIAPRRTGDNANSLTYANKALAHQPDYKPAREYLDELYLDTGDFAKAKEALAVPASLCPNGCDERADLEKALAPNLSNDRLGERALRSPASAANDVTNA